MLNVKTTKIVLLTIAVVVVIGAVMYNTFAINRTTVEETETIVNNQFGKTHYNIMKVDTFEYLLTKAYADQISIGRSAGVLELVLKNSNGQNKDFYNGNASILDYNINDYNFEIQMIENTASIQAKFKIIDDGVYVPNDLLIRIIEKIYN